MINLKSGCITAKTLRDLIANVADDEEILVMVELDSVGYNADTIDFESSSKDDDKEWPATLWVSL